ncbi:hypothetical protein [Methanocalculus sp.]|uniref:hypothetical protein n=1 Tax=Methanocalculus sp. TaxID=2004547 RepID=UPI002606302F|nr:hypothetical protein [Methanocalculus sp.]MDG6250821.1 hypothetical protein [Methanocalculus sp.]
MLNGIINRLKPTMQVFSGETQPIECKPGDTRKVCQMRAENIAKTEDQLLKEIEVEFNKLSPGDQQAVKDAFAQETAKMKLRNMERLDKELAQVKAEEFNRQLMAEAQEQYDLETKYGLRFMGESTQSRKVTSHTFTAKQQMQGDFE